MLDLRKRSDILKYHRWFNRNMLKLERRYKKQIKNVLKDQYQDAADYFRQGIGLESVNDAVDFNKKDMIDVYKNLYIGTSELFHEKTKDNIKSISPKFTKNTSEGEYWALLNRWIELNVAQKVTAVNNNTKRLLNKIISDGVNNGLSNEDIAKSITKNSAITQEWRAMRIARTEVHSASTKATDDTVKGFDLLTIREWSASMDERTRETHAAADGQQVNEEEPFNVGGADLMFPGDPNGPAGEIINCRCVLLYHTARSA